MSDEPITACRDEQDFSDLAVGDEILFSDSHDKHVVVLLKKRTLRISDVDADFHRKSGAMTDWCGLDFHRPGLMRVTPARLEQLERQKAVWGKSQGQIISELVALRAQLARYEAVVEAAERLLGAKTIVETQAWRGYLRTALAAVNETKDGNDR